MASRGWWGGAAGLALAHALGAEQPLPPLPDTTGFGVHVLALARAPDHALWVGSYGRGLFVLRPGAAAWQELRRAPDSPPPNISFDSVPALGCGPRAEIWHRPLATGRA